MLKKSRLNFYITSSIIIFFLILSIDFIYTNLSKKLYPFNFENKKSEIYKNFKPNLKKTYISPIHGKTLFCTDINGFRNNCSNSSEKKFNYLLIGNIFTEGPELAFESTFVGQIVENNKDSKFANLGNRNLDINGFEKKINDIIKYNYVKFDEVILFLGPRVIQKSQISSDLYQINKNQFNFKKFMMENFYLLNNLYNFYLFNTNKTKIWAYSKSNHYASNIKINKNFKDSLNNIYSILNENDKSLSVVIYPYPYHLLYKDFDKSFIYYLEEFCKKKCNFFANTYSDFDLIAKDKNIWKFIKKVYLPYSVHFNDYGNKVIANSVGKYLIN